MTNDLITADNHSLVHSTSWIVTALVLVGVLFRWFALGSSTPPIIATTAFLLMLGNSLYLYRHGSAQVGALVLIGVQALTLAVAGFTSGGYGGPIVTLAPLIPIFAILVINARAGWTVLVLMCAILSVLFALQLSGWVPENPNSPTGILVGRYLAVLFSSLIATWVLWGFSQSIRQLNEENQLLAHTDFLTSLGNRRLVNATLAEEVTRVRRSGGALSVLMIDVDRFKRYNDINGHAAGDECLVQIAGALKSVTRRPTDLVGRYGGEEFIIILPETNAEGAASIGEAVRTSVSELEIPYKAGQPDPVTVSVGAYSCPGAQIENEESLIKRADDALYRAKNEGRNRVVVYHADSQSMELNVK